MTVTEPLYINFLRCDQEAMVTLYIEYSVLATSYFRPEGLSSPLLRFTSVFGMRTGGATAPNHQNTIFKTILIPQSNANNIHFNGSASKQQNSDSQSSWWDRRISTSRLNTLRCVHLTPINVIISHGSQTIPNLGAGFPLICLQRLSDPNLAALRCRWHDSR